MTSLITKIQQDLQNKLFALIPSHKFYHHEVTFNHSFLLSQLHKEVNSPFIRVDLNYSNYTISLIDEKFQVTSFFECLYDDLEFLECVVSGEIPSCVLDLLLNPGAPKLLWNGVIFTEIHAEGTSEKVTTVLKFKHETLMVYLNSMKSSELKSSTKLVLDSAEVETSFEKEVLVGLNPDLDLEVGPKPTKYADVHPKELKFSSISNIRPNWKKLLSGRVKNKPHHIIQHMRTFKPSRGALFLRNHPRAKPRKAFRDLPLGLPTQMSDILLKKKTQFDSYNQSKAESQESELDCERIVSLDSLINRDAAGSVIVPEEKHTIESFGSSHCAEITISRRLPDNFFIGELCVIQRTIQNRSNLLSPGSGGSTSLPFLNEKCCRFELGSRATVNRYVFEYVRMISERDRTPKHTVTHLRKNQTGTM